jgi:hypothetical protein
MDARGSWSLTAGQRHRGGGRPRPTRAPRLQRFARMLPQLLAAQAQPLVRADLRYTNGFALSWGEAPKAPPAATPLSIACADRGRRSQSAGHYMNRKGDKSLIVGLDIGTSKVVALVGEYSPGNPIEVIGIGSHESRGLKRGVVVDIESTVQSIQRAIEEAELMAGCEIRSVYASISGNHVQCRTRPASCRSATARSPGATWTACWKRPRPWPSRPTRRSCTRSRASTCWTIRRKASATRSA